MPTKFKSKYTGVIYDKKEDAIRDNWLYLNNPDFRIGTKSINLKGTKDFKIPFIGSKKRTLTNAGLATGAIISENMLDTIAKYADRAGLPLKTALGLAVKESTLGNPTDDTSVYKILNAKNRKIFKEAGTGQHLNIYGSDLKARHLINFHADVNPYHDLINYSAKKAGFDKDGDNRDENAYIKYLTKGEKYADKKAKDYAERYSNKNVLEAGFRFYKEHPDKYNPGQPNYQQLVDKRGDEVWGSPEVQNWYKDYRRRLESRGTKSK